MTASTIWAVAFGALLTSTFFDLTLIEWVVALLALLVVRPAAVLVSLWRTDLPWRERSASVPS